MAVEVVQSTILSNRDATPRVPNPLYGAGRPFVKKAVVLCVTGKTAPSIYGFFSIRSDAHIDTVLLTCDALSTSVTADLGCYETTRQGGGFATTIAGGVADARYNASALTNTNEIFGEDIDLSGALTKSQQLFANSSFVTRTKADQALWQLLGFTNDPQREFDLVLVTNTTVTAGGAIMVEVGYHLQ